MFTLLVAKTWQRLVLAIVVFFGLGALLHLTLIIIIAIQSRTISPLGLISLLGLQHFFPDLVGSRLESILSIVIYICCIVVIYALVHSVSLQINHPKHQTIERMRSLKNRLTKAS
ncbi:hypothetical protein KC921_00770 [Candidatus Woesebacteria bacterium]|nr:hypothetical protein [Candidatus Woesebacteria bacterium]